MGEGLTGSRIGLGSETEAKAKVVGGEILGSGVG